MIFCITDSSQQQEIEGERDADELPPIPPARPPARTEREGGKGKGAGSGRVETYITDMSPLPLAHSPLQSVAGDGAAAAGGGGGAL
jgi:hypothetical protein